MSCRRACCSPRSLSGSRSERVSATHECRPGGPDLRGLRRPPARRGRSPGRGGQTHPAPLRTLPHCGVLIPPPARRVDLLAGRDALAHGLRRAAPPGALPCQGVGMQLLPRQAQLHQLLERAGGHPRGRALAALGGRQVPPRHLIGSRRSCRCADTGRWGPTPPAVDAGAGSAAAVHGSARAPVQRPLPGHTGQLPGAEPGNRAARDADLTHPLGFRRQGWFLMIKVALLLLVVVLLGLSTANTRVLREYQRGVLFRLGRLRPLAGPGLVFLIPFVDRMERVDLRTVTITIPPQEVNTRDNVPARVNAVAYFRVTDPARAITEVEQYPVATSQIAQTTLRSVLGRAELDDLLAERDQLNDSLRRIIDEQTEPWGIKVTTVEIKDVESPESMQRAMARQAEAERERRAKIINAEGEFQAAQKIYDAAEILSRNPAALQLRYLQTLLELGGEKSTIVFPLPMDLIKPFLGASRQTDGEQAAPGVDLSTVGGALGRLINGSEPLAAKANGAGDEAAGAGKR